MNKLSLLSAKNVKMKVGLLGGSFNPAHEGHLYISLEVLKKLKLDLIYWLVSPQNPLKSMKAPLDKRVKQAKQLVAKYPKIKVSDIEKHFENNYTYNTIKTLKKLHPQTEFIWIMGMDNMQQFPKWYKWELIPGLVPICVVERGDNLSEVLKGEFAKRFKRGKIIKTSYTGDFKDFDWCLLRIKKNPISSTLIRNRESNRKLK